MPDKRKAALLVIGTGLSFFALHTSQEVSIGSAMEIHQTAEAVKMQVSQYEKQAKEWDDKFVVMFKQHQRLSVRPSTCAVPRFSRHVLRCTSSTSAQRETDLVGDHTVQSEGTRSHCPLCWPVQLATSLFLLALECCWGGAPLMSVQVVPPPCRTASGSLWGFLLNVWV
jgi:hypothetical protein